MGVIYGKLETITKWEKNDETTISIAVSLMILLVEEDGSYYSKSGNVIWLADRFMDSKATKRLEYAHRGEFGLLYDDRVPKSDQPDVLFESAFTQPLSPSRSTIDFLDPHLPKGWENFSN